MQLLGYNITTSFPTTFKNTPSVINTINPHSYCISKKDLEFEYALEQSDCLFPDGIGIVWAAKFLKGEKIKKIAGYDIFMHFANQLNQENGSCFFLGASNETLEKIKNRMKLDFPNVEVNSYSPPYKAQFTLEESYEMLKIINKHNPDILFVGMTAPKQEKWVSQFFAEIDTKIICSVGAVFDFYAGTVKRPSAFWIKLGLEWLPRFLKEPKRLAERNLISTPLFIFEVLKHKLLKKQ
jgi:N-acetylglucosaminyldiphosphoundecaprenol N-acetyl-beta-D-mannosaminyltransferase